jgi:LuxR family maltose regulon positive regulatory protein
MIEILVLLSLSHQLRKNTSTALSRLEQAMKIAEQEGFVYPFTCEGDAMRDLLKQVSTEEPKRQAYLTKLPSAFGDRPAVPEQPLFDPLSERELEILALIADGLTNLQIAEQLFLTVNTVKVHTRNIYQKLDTHSRIQAATIARELGLLSPD